jgi:hypothetical protein
MTSSFLCDSLKDEFVMRGELHGYVWEVYFASVGEMVWCVSYVRLDGSSRIVGGYYDETFKEGDIVGFDTNHHWEHGWFSKNEPSHHRVAAHIRSAVGMVTAAIRKHVQMMGEGAQKEVSE